MVVGPSGEVLAKANETEETIVTTTIDVKDVEQIRRERPVFSQRRPELYGPLS